MSDGPGNDWLERALRTAEPPLEGEAFVRRARAALPPRRRRRTDRRRLGILLAAATIAFVVALLPARAELAASFGTLASWAPWTAVTVPWLALALLVMLGWLAWSFATSDG